MTKSGKTFAILSILWKVFIVVIIMHLICICIQFVIAGLVSHKNPFTLIRNQIPGYATALGTQSSAATIPVNLQCAEADGVPRKSATYGSAVREYPHGRLDDYHHSLRYRSLPDEPAADLHRHGHSLHHDPRIAMVASPGAPGGSIMTALPSCT